MWMQNIKMKIIVGVLVIVIILVLFLLICFGLASCFKRH